MGNNIELVCDTNVVDHSHHQLGTKPATCWPDFA